MVVADELLLNVRANTAQAMAGLTGVETKVKGMASFVGKKAHAAGQAITKGLTLPLLAVGAVGIKSFADFDSAMTQSLAIMGDETDAWRDRMETAARDVAKTTTFSAKEAAESYFFLASAGLTAQQSIAALPQVAAFAQAGMFDMATATDLATDAQSALGLTVPDAAENLENLTRVTDVLVRANTLANASVEQFSRALTTKAAAAARLLGMEIEETTSILAVMADAGVKGNIAGTQLSMMLNNMTSNAVKNNDAWTDLGVTVFDGEGKMRKMSDIVADLTVALGGMSDEQKVATIMNLGFGDRAAATVKVLLGTSDAMAEYEDKMRSASGFTQDVASKQLESFTARLGLLKDKVMDAAISLGSEMLPAMTNFAEDALPKLGEGFLIVKDFFLDMPDWAQKAVIAVGLVTLALSAMIAHPIIFGLTVLAGLLIEIGSNARTVAEISEGFTAALDESGDAVASLVAELSKREGIEDFEAMLGRADTSLQGMAEAVAGGEGSVYRFKNELKAAADEYKISTLELSLLTKVLDEMSPAIQADIAQFDLLAKAERAATADTLLLNLAATDTIPALDAFGNVIDEVIPSVEDLGDTTEEEVYKVQNLFSALPEAVDLSLSEVKQLFLDNFKAQQEWETNLQELHKMGMHNLAEEFRSAGPAFAGALDEMLEEPMRQTLLTMGETVGDESSRWGAMVTNQWSLNPPNLTPVPIAFTVGSVPSLPTFTAPIQFLTRSGKYIYHGGVDTVPGPVGANVTATLQAGEGVLSVSENNARKRGEGGGGHGGPLIGQLNVSNQADPVSVAREMGWELLRRGA